MQTCKLEAGTIILSIEYHHSYLPLSVLRCDWPAYNVHVAVLTRPMQSHVGQNTYPQ